VSLQRTTTEHPRKEAPPQRGWLSRPVLTVVLLVGAIVVSAVAGAALASFLTDGPAEVAVDLTPAEDSAEAGFARDMMVHHAQAVEMAEIVRDRTQSEEIRTLAADISLSQQAQIGRMHGWLEAWGLPATSKEPAMTWMGHPTEGRMPGMAAPKDIDELYNASPEEADVLFLQLMIPHHEAALPMAEAALERTDRPEVKRLAGAIAASQEAEIRMMQALLQKRGASPAGDEPPAHAGGH
jgi:uncharacterized protein (DUF305 family)